MNPFHCCASLGKIAHAAHGAELAADEFRHRYRRESPTLSSSNLREKFRPEALIFSTVMTVQPVSDSESLCQTGRESSARSAPLSINLIPGRALCSEEIIIWRELQASNPELCSPCFS